MGERRSCRDELPCALGLARGRRRVTSPVRQMRLAGRQGANVTVRAAQRPVDALQHWDVRLLG